MMNARTIHFFDATDANGHKLFPLMNRSACYDSTNPYFNFPPSDTAKIKTFLYYRWYDAEDIDWAYAPGLSLNRIWPLTEDLAYSNPTLVNAGMNGFPLGDPYRWWPEVCARWELQQNAENARITQWLKTGVDPGTVSVEVLHRDEVPSNYALGQNYPNPFNPATTIQFSIVDPQLTILKAYDILGREVAVLVNERKEPGRYEAKFDAAGLPSGVYLYRLTAGSFVQTHKMLAIK